jgi:hypothetical protein
MTTRYPVRLAITLSPVNHHRPLLVNVGVDQNTTTIVLDRTTTINWEFEAKKSCQLTVEFQERQDQEAVVIDSVSFFGIEDPKFAWAGVYEPEYPEPWATQQQVQGVVLKQHLCPHTYMGWPGKWTLTFDVPVFTWIHQTQNLGWIYG